METEQPFDVTAKPRKGRPPKATNVVTREMRELIRQTLDGFVDRIPALLDDVAETNPSAAIDRFIALSEFCIPKLGRTEHVGDKDNPIEHRVTNATDKAILERFLKQNAGGQKK